MAPENKSVASRLVNLCYWLMENMGVPEGAQEEFLNKASATDPSALESFPSVMYWKSVTANFYAVEEKIAGGPFNSHRKKQLMIIEPQIPDLNDPSPQNEGPSELVIMQDHAKVVKAEVEATTTTGKRKTTQANRNVEKRFKVIAESTSPAINDEGRVSLKRKVVGRTE